MSVRGKINSFQSLGTVDGPGVRFVVFFQGCTLRCKCCHNPDTWNMSEGEEYTAEEVVQKVLRFKDYFGKDGGITLSGGEPLLQADFAREIFTLCRKNGINTCLDTSGCILNASVKLLLEKTDRALLDIKYSNEKQYRENVGCGLSDALSFLKCLNEKGIPTTLRRVIIPGFNDTVSDTMLLKELAEKNSAVDSIELLPFRKICMAKYDNLNIKFPLEHIPEPDTELMAALEAVLRV